MFYKSFRRCITSLAILFSAIFFVGCDSDLGGGSGYGGGSRSDNSIVGTWIDTASFDGWVYKEEITFKSNGQFVWSYSEVNSYQDQAYEETDYGEYTAKNNTLTLYWGDSDDVETYQYEISGDTLTLWDGIDDQDSWTMYRE